MIIEDIVKRIKEKIDLLENVVTFYNDGMVYFSNFPQEINIPNLGSKFAMILRDLNAIQIISGKQPNVEFEYDYKRVIYEIKDYIVMIIKLGQDSNIALFFKSENTKKINISCIQEELGIIEKLIDTTEEELVELGYERKGLN
jgi:hypothetical protein